MSVEFSGYGKSLQEDKYIPGRQAFDALFPYDAQNIEQSESRLFPRAIDGNWDLDELVKQTSVDPLVDPLPHWVQQLSQAEATRLLQLCDDTSVSALSSDKQMERFFQQTAYFSVHLDECTRIVRQLTRTPSKTAEIVRKWLARQGLDGYVEQAGIYVKKPGMLRFHEQKQLVKPNLRNILGKHFIGHPTPHEQRLLMDIGSWDGAIPSALVDIFPHIVAVEPDSERFGQLLSKNSHRFHAFNYSLEEIMANPNMVPYTADAINMGHVHYFLQHDEQDFESLNWMMRTLKFGGIGLVTLNDLTCEPNSRADLRHRLGVSEKAVDPRDYRAYLERKGLAVRAMRPTLNIRASTTEGLVAMRDVMRFLLPGETRHDLPSIDRYVNEVKDAGGVFKHTLYMMAVYKEGAEVPMEREEEPGEFAKPVRRITTRAVPTAMPLTAITVSQLDESLLTRIECIQKVTPARVLELLDYISEVTEGGMRDSLLTEILDRVQISRAVYVDWVQNSKHIELLATNGGSMSDLNPRKKIDPTVVRAEQEMEAEKHISACASELFPQGIPSNLSLKVAGLSVHNGEAQSWFPLARIAHEQRKNLTEMFLRTKVKPVRSLIRNLLILADEGGFGRKRKP